MVISNRKERTTLYYGPIKQIQKQNRNYLTIKSQIMLYVRFNLNRIYVYSQNHNKLIKPVSIRTISMLYVGLHKPDADIEIDKF